MTHRLLPAGFWLLTACGASLDPAADPAIAATERLSAMVEDDLPGIQYVVVDRDGVVFDAALGVRDTASRQPMERDTLQMAYSMTKAVTAVAVMKLVDEGKMGLDEPLSTYFAEHPYGDAVTIRSLLAQTSGVPNPMPLDWLAVEGVSFDRHERLQAELSAHPTLDHDAGDAYAYSNLSYWLLEEAVERASGMDYAEYVEQSLFEPLAIDTEQARFTLGKPAVSATGHSKRLSLMTLVTSFMAPSEYWQETSDGWKRTARVLPHGRAYGGLFTSASALGTLLHDLLQEQPVSLSRTAKDTMFRQQRTRGGEPIDMTLGWVIGELRGARYFGKQGGGLGFHGNVRIYPELGLASAMLANGTELSPGPIDARSDELDEAFVISRQHAAASRSSP